MRSALESALDIMITTLIIVSCLSFTYTTYVKLLNGPSMGFGILNEKSSIKSNSYTEGDIIETFNRYQVACMGLVNSVESKVYTYAEVQEDGVITSDGLKQFSFQFAEAAGSKGVVNLNSRRVPWLSTFSEMLWEDEGYNNKSHGTYIPPSNSYKADIIDENGTLLFYTTKGGE